MAEEELLNGPLLEKPVTVFTSVELPCLALWLSSCSACALFWMFMFVAMRDFPEFVATYSPKVCDVG